MVNKKLLEISDIIAEVRSNGETVLIHKITSVGKKTAYSNSCWYKFVREYVDGDFIAEREPRGYKKLFVIANKTHHADMRRHTLISQLQQLARKGTTEQLETAIKNFEND